MKRFSTLLITILIATAAIAQENTQEEFNTVREFRNKVFSIENRDARTIASTVMLLGSGFQGAGLSVNEELRTITVRDFPENIAAIEDAVKRLDRPVAQSPDVELRVFVLIGSKSPLPGAPLPEELVPVVKQLKATLSYAHYGLMTAAVHRTKPGVGVEGSGVAEPTILGMTTAQERPVFYSYQLRAIAFGTANEQPSVEIGNVEFSMRVPLNLGKDGVQYQSVGFKTPVSLRQRERVVIGTTTMGDKALIVVLVADVK